MLSRLIFDEGAGQFQNLKCRYSIVKLKAGEAIPGIVRLSPKRGNSGHKKSLTAEACLENRGS